MRRRLVSALALVVLASPASVDAQSVTPNCSGSGSALRPVGFQALAVSSAAVSLTVPSGAAVALAIVETGSVRWRSEGALPSSTVGMLATADSPLLICRRSLATFRVIRASGTDAQLSITFYGP